jgi:hypothetical protein
MSVTVHATNLSSMLLLADGKMSIESMHYNAQVNMIEYRGVTSVLKHTKGTLELKGKHEEQMQHLRKQIALCTRLLRQRRR